jgi:hypothetical protein
LLFIDLLPPISYISKYSFFKVYWIIDVFGVCAGNYNWFWPY